MASLTLPTVSIPYALLGPALQEQAQREDAFRHNRFGEFNYGGMNNEKSLNTTLYFNGPLQWVPQSGSITVIAPCKVEGDHKVFYVFGGWQERGRVVSATASIKIQLVPQVHGVGGPLPGIRLTASTNSSVENLQLHIGAPIVGTLLNPLIEQIATQRLNQALDGAVQSGVSQGINNALNQVRSKLPADVTLHVTQCAISFTATEIQLNVTVRV